MLIQVDSYVTPLILRNLFFWHNNPWCILTSFLCAKHYTRAETNQDHIHSPKSQICSSWASLNHFLVSSSSSSSSAAASLSPHRNLYSRNSPLLVRCSISTQLPYSMSSVRRISAACLHAPTTSHYVRGYAQTGWICIFHKHHHHPVPHQHLPLFWHRLPCRELLPSLSSLYFSEKASLSC